MPFTRSIRRILPLLLLMVSVCVPLNAEAESTTTATALSSTADRTIKNYIKETGGDVTLVYHDLDSGREYRIRPAAAHKAASTIKLPLVMYVMELVSERRLSPDEPLTYHSYQYNGGSGVIQTMAAGSRFTIRDLVAKAVVYSDNIAFAMLKDRVGRANFNQYMKRIGGRYAYPGGANLTSAQDLTLYAVKLYHDAQNNATSRELIRLLEHTKYNETIPAGIKDAPVAHKAGWMPNLGVSNDVAIIYDRHPYTLAIMTNGYAYERSKTVIAHIAGLVHQFHQQKYTSQSIVQIRRLPFHSGLITADEWLQLPHYRTALQKRTATDLHHSVARVLYTALTGKSYKTTLFPEYTQDFNDVRSILR